MGGTVALGHTECDVVRGIGAPSTVNLSSDAAGRRVAVVTWTHRSARGHLHLHVRPSVLDRGHAGSACHAEGDQAEAEEEVGVRRTLASRTRCSAISASTRVFGALWAAAQSRDLVSLDPVFLDHEPRLSSAPLSCCAVSGAREHRSNSPSHQNECVVASSCGFCARINALVGFARAFESHAAVIRDRQFVM